MRGGRRPILISRRVPPNYFNATEGVDTHSRVDELHAGAGWSVELARTPRCRADLGLRSPRSSSAILRLVRIQLGNCSTGF